MATDYFPIIATHLIFLISIYLILASIEVRTELDKYLVTGFLAHITIGLILWNSRNINIGDARGFVTYGRRYADYLNGNPLKPLLVNGKEGWPKLLGHIFRLFGYVPEVAIYLNALFLCLAAVFVHLACQELSIHTEKPVAALLILYVPASIYWGSLPGREPLCWLFISMMVYSASRLVKKIDAVPILVLAFATIGMFPIRGSIALGLLGTFVASIGLSSSIGRIGVVERRVLAFLVVAIAAPPALHRVNTQALGGSSAGELKVLLSDANSSFVSEGEVSQSVLSFSTLKSIPNVTLGPLPWEWRPSLFLAIIDAIFWALLWYTIYQGVKRTKRFDVFKLYVFPAAIMIVTMAATLGNYGIVMRMRGLMIPILAPMVALAFIDGTLKDTLKLNKKRVQLKTQDDKKVSVSQETASELESL